MKKLEVALSTSLTYDKKGLNQQDWNLKRFNDAFFGYIFLGLYHGPLYYEELNILRY